MDKGRQEAVRQAQDLLVDAHRALDTFRSSALLLWVGGIMGNRAVVVRAAGR